MITIPGNPRTDNEINFSMSFTERQLFIKIRTKTISSKIKKKIIKNQCYEHFPLIYSFFFFMSSIFISSLYW